MSSVAVIVFPGSNCDRDAFHVISDLLKQEAVYHWHQEPLKKDYRAVILPGGFSYGDYLRAGALAKMAPAVQSLPEYISTGKPVLGICNGFQILLEAGLLPGALVKNQSLSFQSEEVFVRVESNRSPFLKHLEKSKVLKMPIAHSQGRYISDQATLRKLEDNGQIALRYSSREGSIDESFNANGSVHGIAAITNEDGNVMGLMPHPERSAESVLGSNDGIEIFRSMIREA